MTEKETVISRSSVKLQCQFKFGAARSPANWTSEAIALNEQECVFPLFTFDSRSRTIFFSSMIPYNLHLSSGSIRCPTPNERQMPRMLVGETSVTAVLAVVEATRNRYETLFYLFCFG